MATTVEAGERIILSALDTRILVALLLGPMGGYEIARQCELDTNNQQMVSNGTIYPALKALKLNGFIEIVHNEVPRPGKKLVVYQITSTGKMVLSWKIDDLKILIKLARERNLDKIL